jgi:hypothetical protein
MTDRIRWHDKPAYITGHVGSLNPCVFQVFRPRNPDQEWLLTADLPGAEAVTRYGSSEDEIKAEAERWLEEFVSSLGAIFFSPPVERHGKRVLGDADILDSFRTVTNWSDAEVLHYECCEECDPFAGLVCDKHPVAVKLAEAERDRLEGER